MPDPRQGEVYHWPAGKPHPMGTKPHMWVVVSRDSFNQGSRHVLACPLTSYPARGIDVEVQATPHNPLSHTSALLATMITPVRKDQFGRCLGRLGRRVIAQVLDRLRMVCEA